LRSASSNVGRGEHSGFEIADVAVVVGDEIAVGVADGFTATAVGAEVADDGADLADGFVTPEQEHHDTAALAGLGIGCEAFEDVLLEELLDLAVLAVVGGKDGVGVFFDEFGARGEHAETRRGRVRCG